MLRLHNFFRSSASTRVRIALNLKGLDWEYVSCNLRAGDHRSDAFLALNPQGLVPALELDDGKVLSQSLAIIEYLDETHREPPLLPADALGRARVRSLALAIACEVHPLNNLAVLQHIKRTFGADQAGIDQWYHHWAMRTFDALETRLAGEDETGRFCHGDTPGLADICLVAQVMRNLQAGVEISEHPTLERIYNRCLEIEAFASARPELQPDAA